MFDSGRRTKIKNDKVQQWRMELTSFSYVIQYRPGQQNMGLDTFTRAVCATNSDSLSSLQDLHEKLCHPGITQMLHFVRTKILPLSTTRRRRLKGIHSRSDKNRTGAEVLSFYYPRLLNCLNQMLAVVLLSQDRVSSSKTIRPRAPYCARCIEHAVSTWSAVCSEAPHSQFGEGTRPHLCTDE